MPRNAIHSRRFIYSSYWGKWSLLLTERCSAKPGSGHCVEIDLEPIDGWERGDVRKAKSLNVRRHGTERCRGDRYSDELPTDTAAMLRNHLGDDLANWLLDPKTEILGKIDWQLLHSISNGGASLYEVVHPRFRAEIPQPTSNMAEAA